MRPLRPLLTLAVLLVACGSDPDAAPEREPSEEGGSAGEAGAAGKPNGGSSGASSGASGGPLVAGQAGSSGGGQAGTTAGAGGASGQAGAPAGQAGVGGVGGQAGAAGKASGGFAGAPVDMPSKCGEKDTECTCGPSGSGACVKDPKDANARVCDCKLAAKPKVEDGVLTCDAAKTAYPSPSWQAIAEKCDAGQACMAMAPEQAEDLSSKWGDRFCRDYPNPAQPLGGINEGPGKRIYQYCCKPPAPLLPPDPKQARRPVVEVRRRLQERRARRSLPVRL